MTREEFRAIAVGRYYLQKKNEVGGETLRSELLEAYEQGAMMAYEVFHKQQPTAIRIPLWNVDSANFKMPESKL